MTTQDTTRPETTPATAAQVAERELRWHLGKNADDPLVGLAFSGGGIRSATFGLGVLQSLRALGVFRHIDYISTVSGGGYIGGWLQGCLARGRGTDALSLEGAEPREVRFLRAYSNYLTPQLGLFSGDTWAAVGNSLRNLALNLSVLSLSLIAPLYLPWIAALLFWRQVPSEPEAWGTLVVAGALLALTVAVSTLNMARPLKDGTWSKAGVWQAPTWQVHLLVVAPMLVAAWLISTVAWAWARHEWLQADTYLFRVVGTGAIAFGAIWLVGPITGYAIGSRRFAVARARTGNGRPVAAEGDLRAAAEALVVLMVTAMLAGAVGTFTLAVAAQAFVSATRGWHTWLSGLLVYPMAVLGLLAVVTVHIGLAGRRLSDETREWWGRVGGTQLLVMLLGVVLSTLALGGPHLMPFIADQARHVRLDPSVVIATLGGLWAAITSAGVYAGRSARTSSGSGGWLEQVGSIAPIVFVVGYLVILASLLESTVPHLAFGRGMMGTFTLGEIDTALAAITAETGSRLWIAGGNVGPVLTPNAGAVPPYELSLVLMCAVTGMLAWLLSWRVDLNEFSLHALYRNRLVRCYLGASNEQRSAHPFTGFDSNDDLPIAPADASHRGLGQAPTSALPPTDAPPEPARIRPYPIFNCALNLVGGKNLAWQQRKAASFIFSPEYSGFEYRVDEDNEQERKGGRALARRSAYAPTTEHAADRTSLSVGLAVATSGAAASPNMGYHSSPTLAFLMTVFNVRLGWWLRNPRWPQVWRDPRSGLSLRELLSELLGMTTDDRAWVYLSDGGHFENLGVYELVRRRCRFIIACDAGQDGRVTFEDLGNLIEKCRADFGVDIDIDLDRIRLDRDARWSAWHCAVGTIYYDRMSSDTPPGTLLYLKSSLTGDEPADVLRYAAQHASFPQESTADQFFDESQFESYRALGAHVASSVLRAVAEPDELREMSSIELFSALRAHWTQSAPAPPDAVRKYASALSEIWAAVRNTPNLAFLDEQMFPEWTRLMAIGQMEAAAQAALPARATINYWLPPRPEQRRAGFYICTQMLQLMEDVYLEFQLDEHYDHIDNRGWMNLFQHWSWSGMLGATFAITGSNYDPRFQRFCLRRLGLKPGEPYVAADAAVALSRAPDWRRRCDAGDPTCANEMQSWQDDAGLNFWEATLVDRFLRACTSPAGLQLVPIRVVVESPRASDGHPLDFNVGFLIGETDWDRKVFVLHHMRIQNHLRKMGLARAALRMIGGAPPSGWGLTIDVVVPAAGPADHSGVALAEAIPTPESARRVQRIVRSLPRPVSPRDAAGRPGGVA
jgi:hypothetical protein